MRTLPLLLVFVMACGNPNTTAPPEKPGADPVDIRPTPSEREVEFNPKDATETLQWFTVQWKRTQEDFKGNGILGKREADRFTDTVRGLAKSGKRVEWRVKCGSVSADGHVSIQDLFNKWIRLGIAAPEEPSRFRNQHPWSIFNMKGQPWLESLQTGHELIFRGTIKDFHGSGEQIWVFIFTDVEMEPVR